MNRPFIYRWAERWPLQRRAPFGGRGGNHLYLSRPFGDGGPSHRL